MMSRYKSGRKEYRIISSNSEEELQDQEYDMIRNGYQRETPRILCEQKWSQTWFRYDEIFEPTEIP